MPVLEALPAQRLDMPMERLQTDGLLAIDKQRGPTSHDVVGSARRILGQRRIGHCGTLDPLATGVLILCIGSYTRLAELLSDSDKDYSATVRLGAVSDTYDSEGTVEETHRHSPPGWHDLEAAVAAFRGDILQTPPPYSAVKVNGIRSHRLARRGVAVTLQPRRVTVSTLQLSRYEYPLAELRITCSKGTYVRSIAHDLGQILGCGGYIEQLRRTRVGAVGEELAIQLADLARAADEGSLEGHMLRLRDALGRFPHVTLPDAAVAVFARGNVVALDGSAGPVPTCAVFDESGAFWGLGEIFQGGRLQPRKVMPPKGVSAGSV
jgi:tRNA pseudouridine55 synthase